MDKRERLIKEMQMLTGVMTEDFDYLVYLLLQNGKYFEEEYHEQSKYEKPEVIPASVKIESFEDWFAKL